MPEVGPGGLGIIETMMGFPDPDPSRLYEFFRGNIRDKESKETMFPVEYLFKQNVPSALTEDIDPVEGRHQHHGSLWYRTFHDRH